MNKRQGKLKMRKKKDVFRRKSKRSTEKMCLNESREEIIENKRRKVVNVHLASDNNKS